MKRHPIVASILALLAVVASASCSPRQPGLQPVQLMAYTVKPAVVRVTVLATAELHYDLESIREAETYLNSRQIPIRAKFTTSDLPVVETGTGGSGSGFIIHPGGWILTNAHVINATRTSQGLRTELKKNGAISALLQHFPVETLRALHRGNGLEPVLDIVERRAEIVDVRVTNRIDLSNGDSAAFSIENYSPPLDEGGLDLALVRIDRNDLPTLRIGRSDEVKQLEEIWVVGYPSVASSSDEVIGGWLSRDSDLEPTFNPGTITAIKLNAMNTPVFQTDAPLYPGNSGGPAVNRSGEVIGIPTWGHADVEQIRFLVPVNLAMPMLADSGIPLNVESEFNERYGAALDAAARGNWSAASRDLAIADRLFPGSPDVIRFLRDAERGAANREPWSRRPWVAAATVLLVILIAGAVLMARHTSGPTLPHATIFPERMIRPRGARSSAGASSGGPAAREIPAPLGRFTILNGEQAGQRLGLGGAGLCIGRESAMCEIVLTHPKVSRLHAEIVTVDGKIMLVDRNSSNGTYVNDVRIDRAYLEDGDIIYFGGRNAVAVAYNT